MTIAGPPLAEIERNLYVCAPPKRGWGLANCGLLVGGDTALWIDAPYDRTLAESFLAQSRAVMAEGTEIDRVVVTHANGDHLWGAVVVDGAEVITTREARAHQHFEPQPHQQQALVNGSDPSTPWGAYLKKHFGVFDWSDTEPVKVTTTFTGELELTVGDYPVRLASLPSGHTGGDLFVHLPDHNTVFTGDVIFSSTQERPGDHPVHWAGPLSNLIDSCERFLATGAELFVPGHGPLLDRGGVREHIAYLDYIRDRAHVLHTAGVPLAEATRRVIAERRYPELDLPERLLITIGAEYRDLAGIEEPPDMLETMGAIATLAWELEQEGAGEVPTPSESGGTGR